MMCLFSVVLLAIGTLQQATFKLGNHPIITAYDLMDQTDGHNELLHTREWTAQWNEGIFDVSSCVFDVRNADTGIGRVFVRFSPLPHARPEKVSDFVVDSRGRTVTVLSNGYPWISRDYVGGRIGRIRALALIQRSIRPHCSGRDGKVISNTWGGGFGDSKLDEQYALREIDAAASLGVEVVELDDGWQKGRSANSQLIEDGQPKGVWDGYWSIDPNFWDPDPLRFPRGLSFLTAYARSKGLDLGLWFGPDSSNEARNWEKDAGRLLSYFRECGVRYFKVDSMKSVSSLAIKRQRALFDRVLEQSSSNVVFDLDVTAEIRPGYFGLPDIGTLFVENRYAKHCSWWPHLTLRNLWSLCEVIDPVRLRMEFLDPKQHAGLYAVRYPGSPLRPELWSGDAVFATVMLSSPLAWMEMQGLRLETATEMRKIIEKWKQERDHMHAGITFPVGSKPDGFSWTGFVVVNEDQSDGYVLLFRECSEAEKFKLDMESFHVSGNIEILSGSGCARIYNECLEVEIPQKLGYLWLAIRSHNEKEN